MRNMSLGITAFVVSVGMISVGAQGRNFSGTWVIDSEKTAAAMQSSGETPGGSIVARGVGGGGTGGSATGGAVSAGGGGRVIAGGGGGGAAVGGGSGGGVMTAAAGVGGARVARGGVAVSTDMTITMDGTTFSVEQGGTQSNYPLDGSETTIQTRGGQAKARASWKGDTLIIEQTIDSPNGPVTSTTSWFMEGDSLVRLTARRTYYKKK